MRRRPGISGHRTGIQPRRSLRAYPASPSSGEGHCHRQHPQRAGNVQRLGRDGGQVGERRQVPHPLRPAERVREHQEQVTAGGRQDARGPEPPEGAQPSAASAAPRHSSATGTTLSAPHSASPGPRPAPTQAVPAQVASPAAAARTTQPRATVPASIAAHRVRATRQREQQREPARRPRRAPRRRSGRQRRPRPARRAARRARRRSPRPSPAGRSRPAPLAPRRAGCPAGSRASPSPGARSAGSRPPGPAAR